MALQHAAFHHDLPAWYHGQRPVCIGTVMLEILQIAGESSEPVLGVTRGTRQFNTLKLTLTASIVTVVSAGHGMRLCQTMMIAISLTLIHSTSRWAMYPYAK